MAGSCLSSSQAYWRIAIVRLAGIVLGVILAQLASITIYSETHTDTAIARLQASLRCTAELCESAWLAWHLTDKPHIPTFLMAPAEELKAALQQASQVQPRSLPDMLSAEALLALRSSDEREDAGDPESVPPISSTAAQISPAHQATLSPAVVFPNQSLNAQLQEATGAAAGGKILGILQVCIHSSNTHVSGVMILVFLCHCLGVS